MIGFVAAWTGHTDESRQLAEDVTRAIDAVFDKREAAAVVMGLHPADLSRQLAGRDPLNAWRLAHLPASFWLAFLCARARRFGAEVLLPDMAALIRGAAALGPRMLSSLLKKEGAA